MKLKTKTILSMIAVGMIACSGAFGYQSTDPAKKMKIEVNNKSKFDIKFAIQNSIPGNPEFNMGRRIGLDISANDSKEILEDDLSDMSTPIMLIKPLNATSTEGKKLQFFSHYYDRGYIINEQESLLVNIEVLEDNVPIGSFKVVVTLENETLKINVYENILVNN